jgi:hypothetical protein
MFEIDFLDPEVQVLLLRLDEANLRNRTFRHLDGRRKILDES